MAAVLGLMDSPLVSWIRTVVPGGTVDFEDLCDAVFLNDVLLAIDQRGLLSDINRDARDSNAKIQNWMVLLRNIKAYYQDVLQQLIVMDPPNVLAIVHEPDKERSVRELQNVLLLLLGCAVQCEDKEKYINAIKGLPIDTQAAIVGYIKQMTDSHENVISLDGNGEVSVKSLLLTVKRLAGCRDSTGESILKLSQERDYYRRELEGKRGPLTPPDHLETVHLYNELNKYRTQVNQLVCDVEEKAKQLSDTKEDLEASRNALNKLKNENLGLSKDAKSAVAYRDEVDMLKEKALRADKLEKDIKKYKEKMSELDFYKSRVQELREDNNVLLEAKNKIEEQLTAANKRSENMVDDLVRAQLQLEEVCNEKERIQKKMEEVIEENAALEFERTNLSEGYKGGLKRILSTSSDLFSGSQFHIAEHPISEELNDSINGKVAKLELENEALHREMKEAQQKLSEAQMEVGRLKAAAEREYKKKVSDLELQTVELRKRNSMELADSVHQKIKEVERQGNELRKRMTMEYQQKMQNLEKILLDKEKQVKSIQEERSKDKQHITKLEKRNEEVNVEKDKYKSTLEHMHQSSQGRVDQLEHKVSSLQALNASLQRRLSDLSPNVNQENACVALETEKREHRESSSRHKSSKSSSRNHPLSQSFDTSDYARTRHSSSRNSRGSNSSIHSMHEMDPRYVTMPRAHRTHKHSSSQAVEQQQQQQHRHKSGSRTSLNSTHSQTQGMPLSSTSSNAQAQMNNAHAQTSPFVRGSSSRSTAPARGVVAPQRRVASPPQPQPSPSSPFMRHDKSRFAMVPSRSKSVEIEPFSRDNKLRASMPVRQTVYVSPERRPTTTELLLSPDLSKMRNGTVIPRRPSSSIETYHTLPLPDKHNMYASTGVAMNSPNLEKSPSFHEKWKESGSDSGHATSPDSPESSSNFENGHHESRDKDKHRLTSVEILSSETIRTQFRSSSRSSQIGGEKWKYFVDKIVDLQDRNQKLILENTDLKKVSNTREFTSDLLRSLKERNLILEVENRKLKKIIEMLQGGGRNPNDPREYHFYTNV